MCGKVCLVYVEPAFGNDIDSSFRDEGYKMVTSVSSQECRLCLPSQRPSQKSLPFLARMSEVRGSVQLSGKWKAFDAVCPFLC